MQFDFSPKGMLAIAHLRLKWLWLGVGALLILAVVFGSLTSLPGNAPMMHDKLLHLLVYATLMGWFAQIFRHDLTRLVLVVGLMLLGVGMEFAQAAVPYRRFEILDMVANSSGVLLAWALSYTWVGRLLEWFESGVLRVLPSHRASV